jgi:mono/diheme cytochrome c family protein
MKNRNALRVGSYLLGAVILTGCVAAIPAADAGVATQVAGVPSPPPHPAIIPPEALSTLPEGVGRETTIRVCSGCHAVELVTEKRLTRQEWFDLVQFMGDRGATGTPAEMAEITDYLAKAFPKP